MSGELSVPSLPSSPRAMKVSSSLETDMCHEMTPGSLLDRVKEHCEHGKCVGSRSKRRCSVLSLEKKILLREGVISKKSKFLPRWKKTFVQLYLVPPMICYHFNANSKAASRRSSVNSESDLKESRSSDTSQEFFKCRVIHIDNQYSVSMVRDKQIRVSTESNQLIGIFTNPEEDDIEDWFDDFQSLIEVARYGKFPECKDFQELEVTIEKLKEQLIIRDKEDTEKAVALMRNRLGTFMDKYEHFPGMQRLTQKYFAWLDCAESCLDDLENDFEVGLGRVLTLPQVISD